MAENRQYYQFNSKQRIFDRAAERQALAFAHHFAPFPNLGYVIKRAEGWRWQQPGTYRSDVSGEEGYADRSP